MCEGGCAEHHVCRTTVALRTEVCLQEKHDQLAQEAVRQRRQTAAEAQAWPKASMLAAVVRLRQACTHPSLLPEELQVETANSSSSDDEQMTSSGSQDDQPSAVQKTAVSYAEAVQRIQAQRKDSTKLKRVLRIIKVTFALTSLPLC